MIVLSAKCNKCGKEYIPNPDKPESTCEECQKIGTGQPFYLESGPITEEMNEQYISNNGVDCPFCGAGTPEIVAVPEMDTKGVQSIMGCPSCKKAWYEVCYMHHIEQIHEETELYKTIETPL